MIKLLQVDNQDMQKSIFYVLDFVTGGVQQQKTTLGATFVNYEQETTFRAGSPKLEKRRLQECCLKSLMSTATFGWQGKNLV